MKEAKKPKVVADVEQDHIALNQDIGTLKIWMMKEVTHEDFSDWRLEFIWQLRDFRNHLMKHFDLEERGGVMAEMLQAAPHSQKEISDLEDDHTQILDSLDGLLAKLEAMKSKDSELLEEVRLTLNSLISTIREHENREHILMQRAYFREYGGPS